MESQNRAGVALSTIVLKVKECVLTRYHMSSDSMDVNALTVDLEIDPINHKALDKPQNGFSEESIEPKCSRVLVQSCTHFVAYDEGHKLFRSFTLVFYIDSRIQVEVLIVPGLEALGKPPCIAL